MKYTALYLRVSTQEQAAEGYSIDEQAERLKKYCAAMNWRSYKIYTDAGYSGGNTNRPALQDLIKDVKDGKISKVVVYKLDRLSRSQKDTLNLIEDIFLKNGVDFVSMNENFDTATPFGRAMVGILAVFAQLEREQIKERVSMGREGRAKNGKFHGGGFAPVGYDYIDGELVINEFERLQILEIYDRFLNGQSFNKILHDFDDMGYRHKYGIWSYKNVRNALTNPLYLGKITYNGETYDGTHQPIIDIEKFEKAKEFLKIRSAEFENKNITSRFGATYFGGLIFCARCGARYGVTKNYRKNKNGDKMEFKYYSCYSRRKQMRTMVKDPNCKNTIYRVDKFDAMIFDEIKKLELEPDYISEIQGSNPDADLNKVKTLKAEIEKINNQRSRLMDLFSLGQFDLSEIQEKITPLNDQREKLQQELENITASDNSMKKEDIIKTVRSFSDALVCGTFDQVKMLIETLIEKIEIDGDNIKIFWRFA